MKRRGWIKIIPLLWIAAAIGLAGCGGAAGAPAASLEPTATDILPPIISDLKIIAEAEVIPVRNAMLSFPSGGLVAEVLVAEGEKVKEGELIARLEGAERLDAAVTAAELSLVSAQNDLKKLEEDAALAYAQAYQAKTRAEKALDDAIKKRANREYFSIDRNILDQALANYYLAVDEVNKTEKTFGYFQFYPEDNQNRAYSLSQLAAARQERDRRFHILNKYLEGPNALDIAKADAEIEVARAQMQDAEREMDRLKDGPNPDDLALAQARVRNAEAQLASARKAFTDIELRAPFAGTVVANDLKTGELAPAGSTAAIVADLTAFQVETTDLTELNIVDIRVGEEVTVAFDAIPDLELPGRVNRIKELGVNKQGDITYTVVIDLDQQDERLRWNMTATVSFESRT